MRYLLAFCAVLLFAAVGCKKDAAYNELTQHRAAGEKAPTFASGASGTETDQSSTNNASDDDPSVEDQGSKDRRAAARKSLGL